MMWICPTMTSFFASLAVGFGVLNMYKSYVFTPDNPSDVIAVGVSLLWIVVIM